MERLENFLALCSRIPFSFEEVCRAANNLSIYFHRNGTGRLTVAFRMENGELFIEKAFVALRDRTVKEKISILN
jgi:hypothetical protein